MNSSSNVIFLSPVIAAMTVILFFFFSGFCLLSGVEAVIPSPIDGPIVPPHLQTIDFAYGGFGGSGSSAWSQCTSGKFIVSNGFITDVSGTRTVTNGGITTTAAILGIYGESAAFSSLSPYLDQSGLTFQLNSAATYPNGLPGPSYRAEYPAVVNVFYLPGSGYQEDGGEVGLSMMVGSTSSCASFSPSNQIYFAYSAYGMVGNMPYSLCSDGIFLTNSPLTSTSWLLTGVQGVRQIKVAGLITGTGLIGLALGVAQADNVLSSTAPYVDADGITFILGGAAVYPATTLPGIPGYPNDVNLNYQASSGGYQEYGSANGVNQFGTQTIFNVTISTTTPLSCNTTIFTVHSSTGGRSGS